MIRILTATDKGQGMRPDDFNRCLSDEPVTFGTECESCSVESACGCKRSMVGLKSYQTATTFEVTESDMTRQHFERMIFEYLVEIGMNEISKLDDLRVLASRMADDIFYITNQLQIGDVVEKAGDEFKVRLNIRQNIKDRLNLKLGGLRRC